jgi:branched-chain amino acid aminotransferase
VEERAISIDEVLSDAQECFVTGTAAGVSYIESLTHQGKTAIFNQGKMGDLTLDLLQTLKGIQYGSVKDTHKWMVEVPLAKRG